LCQPNLCFSSFHIRLSSSLPVSIRISDFMVAVLAGISQGLQDSISRTGNTSRERKR
ncbi:hypothetical protein RvY_05308, partial [Ramazzottius varieornatus]